MVKKLLKMACTAYEQRYLEYSDIHCSLVGRQIYHFLYIQFHSYDE